MKWSGLVQAVRTKNSRKWSNPCGWIGRTAKGSVYHGKPPLATSEIDENPCAWLNLLTGSARTSRIENMRSNRRSFGYDYLSQPAILLAAVVLAFFGIADIAPLGAETIPDVPGWQLAWHDEFDGGSLDTTKWTALNRRDSFNNEKQYYHPNQVAVADDTLHLTAIDVPRSGKAYQSGLVTSNALFGIGRFEARIDLPTSQGMWPAFWLNANHIQWPTGGEIDILENRGSQPELVSSAYHWQTNPGPCCNQHEFVYHEHTATESGQPVNFHEGFHTYAVEWDENSLYFFVDGQLHYRLFETSSRPIFETPKNIILNLAVGGIFGGDPDGTTVWPQTMKVDYVRYWQRQTGLPGDYNEDGTVDAADYSLWRDSLGNTGIGLAADGSGNGTVDAADYDIWRVNFGASASSAASVPEPMTGLLAVVLIAQLASCSARRR